VCDHLRVPTPEQFLTVRALREVPHGPAKIARYVGGDLCEIFFAPHGRPSRREGSALTDNVRRNQRPGSFESARLERIIADLS